MDIVSGLIAAGLLGYWILRAGSQKQVTQETPKDSFRRDWRQECEERGRQQEAMRRAEEVRWREEHPPFSDARTCFEQQYVSFTRIKTYCSCPQRFKLLYLDRCRPLAPLHDVYKRGTIFHEAVAAYLNRYLGTTVRNPNTSAMLSSVPQNFTTSRLLDAAKFFCNTFPCDATVVAVEHELSFVVGTIRFYGIVDAVLRYPDGGIELVDFKTGKSYLPVREQLELYGLPYAQASPSAPLRLRFMFVDKCYHYTWTLTPEHAQQSASRIGGIVSTILADKQFAPVVGPHCEGCGARADCEHRPKGRRRGGHKSARRRKPNRRGVQQLTTIRYHAPHDGGFEYMESPEQTALRGAKPKAKAPKKRRHSSQGKSFDLVVAKRDYICFSTGLPIRTGSYHFADHRGNRMTVQAFQQKFGAICQEKLTEFVRQHNLSSGDTIQWR